MYETIINLLFDLKLEEFRILYIIPQDLKKFGDTFLLLLLEVGNARMGATDVHPIRLKTPVAQYKPKDRKKRKGKTVENKKRSTSLSQ